MLYRNQPGRGQIVSAVSPAAEVSGARIGMPLSEARSLVGRSRKFAGHHVFEHQAAADLRVLQQLAMDCQRFSPIVGLPADSSPGSLLLDVSGLTHLFGGDDGLRNHVHQYFQSLGYLVSTAISKTPGKAWALARYANLGSEPSCDDVFERLPVAALRLQEATVDTLQQLGVQSIFQVRALPRSGLRSRFGDEIIKRLDQADGIIDEVIEAIYPPADYQAEKFLDYPVTDRQTVEVLVSRLADQLCQQMRATGRGGLVWHFQLNGPPGEQAEETQASKTEPRQMTIKLFQPTASLSDLVPLMKMQMAELFQGRRGNRKGKKTGRRKQLAFQVQEVIVSVRNCVLLAERQRQLFDENPRLDKQALAHLINRLSSRLGQEHVLRPVLQSGAQAEDNCYFEPLVGQKIGRKNGRRRRSGGWRNAASPLQRPLTLYPQPVPIAAVSLDGTPRRSSGIPALFLQGQQRLKVKRRWGPERIETAWWRGPTVRRDYWRIETEEGRWVWVYRDLQERGWFLHGEF